MIAESKSKGAARTKSKRTDIVRSRQVMNEMVEPLGSRTVGRPSQAVDDPEARDIKEEIEQLRAERENDERQIKLIPLYALQRHPSNRTIDPKDPSIASLAESIKENGQMDPLRVRQISCDRYQIISGERRFTAMQLAEVRLARCIVVNIGNALALREVAVANSNREDLNPIQRAELMQQLMLPETNGGASLTLLEAGKLFGLNSESGCKNALRMLKLPPKIRDLVISGQLPERVARRLIPYLANDEIGKAIADDLTHQHFGEENMLRLWQDDLSWIEETLVNLVRPLSSDITHYYPYPKGEHSALFEWQNDPKLIEQLKIVELPWSTEFDPKTRRDRIEPRKFATNVKLWHKLNAPLVEAAIETGKKSKQKGGKDTVGRPSQAVKQTPAQIAAEAKRKAKEADDRLNNFTREWLCRLLRCSLADRSTDDELVALTLPWIVGQCPGYDLRTAHEQACIECQITLPKSIARENHTLAVLPLVNKGNAKAFDVQSAFWRVLLWPVSRLIGDDAKRSKLTAAGKLPEKLAPLGYSDELDHLLQLISFASVSAETAWREGATDDSDQRRLISVWLCRHTKDQLRQLCTELKVTPGSNQNRDELAGHILSFHRPGKPLPVPKRLTALAKY